MMCLMEKTKEVPSEIFPLKLPGKFAHDTLCCELVQPRSSLGFLNINPSFPPPPPPASEAPPPSARSVVNRFPSRDQSEPESPQSPSLPRVVGSTRSGQPPHRQSPRAEVCEGWKARKLERVFSGKGIASLAREESSKIITRGCCLQLRLVQLCWVSGGLLLLCRRRYGGGRAAL